MTSYDTIPEAEQSAVKSDTRDRLFAYCQKAEGDDRLLLLFLFGFLYSVTIDDITYVLGQDFSFSSPLCKVYKKLFPDLALFLYNNGFIPDTNMKSLKNFLYDYYSSTPPFRHQKRKKGYEKSPFIRKNIIQHPHFIKNHPLFLSYLGSFF